LEILAGLAAVCALLLLGGSFLRRLGLSSRADRLSWIGYALLSGALLLGALVLLVLVCGARPGPWSMSLLALTAVALLLLVPGSRPRRAAGERAPRVGRGELVVFLLVVAAALFAALDRIVDANASAIVLTDEAWLWASRAKLAFRFGIGERFGELARPPLVWHPDYPALNPLLQIAVFGFAGEVTAAANRLPIQAQSLAMILILAGALRRVVRPAVAAIFVLLVVTTTEMHLRTAPAMADMMVAVGLLAVADGWLRRDLTLTAVALTYLAWSKHEGTLHIVALVAALAAVRLLRRDDFLGTVSARRLAALFAAPAAVLLATWLFNHHHDLKNDLVSDFEVGRLLGEPDQADRPRALQVGSFLLTDVLLSPRATRLLFVLPLILLLSHGRRLWRGALAVPGLAMALIAAGYTAVFLWTPLSIEFHLASAGVRVYSHLLPAVALWTAAAAAEVFPGLRPPPRGGSVRRPETPSERSQAPAA